jgi:hypothetical protein
MHIRPENQQSGRGRVLGRQGHTQNRAKASQARALAMPFE